jgi:hypothetical protein
MPEIPPLVPLDGEATGRVTRSVDVGRERLLPVVLVLVIISSFSLKSVAFNTILIPCQSTSLFNS